MLDLTTNKCTPDKAVTFCDGLLYIIHGSDSCTQMILHAEFDRPISLSDIAIRYPTVKKVIFEDALKGYVYNYKNHRDATWECVGTTLGYV